MNLNIFNGQDYFWVIKMKKIRLRAAETMFIIMALLLVSLLRVAVVMSDEKLTVSASAQNSFIISLQRQRGTIFDANLVRLTNKNKRIYTAVSPTNTAFSVIRNYLSAENLRTLRKNVSSGNPAVMPTPIVISGEGVLSAAVSAYYDDTTLAPHIIGYMDSAGHGVSGVEKTFDAQLYSGKTVDFRFIKNSHGKVVDKFGCELSMDDSVEKSGVALTIESELQILAEKTAGNLGNGAVIISEVGSGKIRALASSPSFNPESLSEYLTDDGSPLVNRALSAYNVGSVFKTCIAAAALENGYGDFSYNCEGNAFIAGKNFPCHKSGGHGELDLCGALRESCNTYFYALGKQVGADAIYDLVENLGLNISRGLFSEIYYDKGNLPSRKTLSLSEQALANFSIGQGELLLSPAALLPLYEAVANGGVFYSPQLLEGYVENGKLYGEPENYPTRAFTKETAEKLKEALISVVSGGTGTAAAPKNCKAAGKTATAQTGWLIDDRKVEHSWFCGFFPAENPRYVIVMLSEDANGGGEVCAPHFAALADAIYSIKLS